jgi:hypothetical protein
MQPRPVRRMLERSDVHRIRNEAIWACAAAVVCGIAIGSLLSGSAPPWPLLAVVIVLAISVTGLQSRRSRVGLAHVRRRRSRRLQQVAAENVEPDWAQSPGWSGGPRWTPRQSRAMPTGTRSSALLAHPIVDDAHAASDVHRGGGVHRHMPDSRSSVDVRDDPDAAGGDVSAQKRARHSPRPTEGLGRPRA